VWCIPVIHFKALGDCWHTFLEDLTVLFARETQEIVLLQDRVQCRFYEAYRAGGVWILEGSLWKVPKDKATGVCYY
jgi:hypothetical protein